MWSCRRDVYKRQGGDHAVAGDQRGGHAAQRLNGQGQRGDIHQHQTPVSYTHLVKKKGAKQPTPTLDVLKGIDIDIYRGDVVCLIGPSGCGKSTFLRCLNRLEIPTSGSIKFEGVEVDDAHIDAVRQKMGMVFQHFNLFPHLTVKKNLELAPSLLKLKDKEAISQRADELLARVGLADKANVYPKSLSGGQQQRIAICLLYTSRSG